MWAGSGTSNTLDDSIITQSNTSASAIATISSTSDYQLRLHSTNTWSGIQFDDNGPAPSTIWHNATYGTFALGGGGSNVSGKKLHVHGAASIGSSYAASAAPSNGLIVEGNVGIGTISPSTKLEVAASATTSVDIAHFSNSNDVVKIKHALDGLGSGRVSIFDASNNEDVRLSAQSNSWFNAGNVGIGTTSPVTNLTVVQSGVMPTSGFSATQWVGAFVNTGAVDRIARVGIYSGNNSFSLLNFGDVDDADIGGISYSNIDNSMALRTNNGERVRINNVGAIKFNAYDSTNNTGTPTYLLGTDASGNVVKTSSTPSPITSQADSLYDLIPNGAFTTTYAFTSTAGTYSEVMKGDDVITAAGTYSVQMYVSDHAVGGTQYREYYSGVMSWNAPDSTNDTGIGAVSEISLHRAGHAGNSGIIYLRTRETGSTGGNELKLEIMCNRTYSAASNVVFKFVRLI